MFLAMEAQLPNSRPPNSCGFFLTRAPVEPRNAEMDASKCRDVSRAVPTLLGRKGALSQGSLPQSYKSPRLTANLWAAAGSSTTPWKTWGHQSWSVRGTLWVSFLGHVTYDLRETDGQQVALLWFWG